MHPNWTQVAKGRHAAKVNGDVVQVMYSPDPERTDQRPYIALVDKTALDRRFWSLREAKTAALDAIGKNGHARQQKMMPHIPVNRADEAGAVVAALEHMPAAKEPVEIPEPEPETESQTESVDVPADVAGELEIYLEPAAVQADGGNRVSVVLTANLCGPDAILLLNQVQAAVQLLRELGDVSCDIGLPDGIRL